MPRIKLPSREDGAEISRIFDRIAEERPRLKDAYVYRLLALQPAVADLWLPLGTRIREATGLDPREIELVILAVSQARESEYEFNQHWNLGLDCGVTPDQLATIDTFETSPAFSDAERALMRLAREVALTGEAGDTVWTPVHERLGDARTVGLLFLVGWYLFTSALAGPTKLELEPWFRRR